ncbi:MAG: (2Fe-2S)-binding protein [Actinomycetota bacterium]
MIVCHCFVVNDRRIAELASEFGAPTIADIRAACGASSDCGSCAATIRQILADRAETAVSLV